LFSQTYFTRKALLFHLIFGDGIVDCDNSMTKFIFKAILLGFEMQDLDFSEFSLAQG
jgi:hypothetical protein